MKKLITGILIAAMACSLAACGNSSSSGNDVSDESITDTGVNTDSSEEDGGNTNAVDTTIYGVTEEALVEKTGVDLPAPDGAEDVVYNVYNPDSDTPMGEMNFKLDGTKAYMRAMPTATLPAGLSNDSTSEEILAALNTGGLDISGLYYDWSTVVYMTVQDREAIVCVDDSEGVGFIAWIDPVPGILYNVCMENDADCAKLQEIAEKAFVPVQGEAE